jgi:hypothetical protein
MPTKNTFYLVPTFRSKCVSHTSNSPPPPRTNTAPGGRGHILGNSGLEEKSLCPCRESKHGQPVWNHIYFVVNLVKIKATAVFAISQRTSWCNEGEVRLSARPGRLLLAITIHVRHNELGALSPAYPTETHCTTYVFQGRRLPHTCFQLTPARPDNAFADCPMEHAELWGTEYFRHAMTVTELIIYLLLWDITDFKINSSQTWTEVPRRVFKRNRKEEIFNSIHRNFFLLLNFIPALTNVYYIHLPFFFFFFLTVHPCFAFKKYTSNFKFSFRTLIIRNVLAWTLHQT